MIWQACNGEHCIQPIRGQLYRLIESQQQVATMGYVDTLAEQALLEELLDSAKPPYPADFADYHYLLKTPFRYPPLKWGSRFGQTHENGLFYAAIGTHTTLAESAYYRFVFLHSMQSSEHTGGTRGSIRTEHTLFSVDYETNFGINLHAAPFDRFRAELIHASHYGPTQQLGSAMREAGVQAFEYSSARDPRQGQCIGLFSPAALVQKKPKETQQWLCELTPERVSYKQIGDTAIIRFDRSVFLVNEALPLPAA